MTAYRIASLVPRDVMSRWAECQLCSSVALDARRLGLQLRRCIAQAVSGCGKASSLDQGSARLNEKRPVNVLSSNYEQDPVRDAHIVSAFNKMSPCDVRSGPCFSTSCA